LKFSGSDHGGGRFASKKVDLFKPGPGSPKARGPGRSNKITPLWGMTRLPPARLRAGGFR